MKYLKRWQRHCPQLTEKNCRKIADSDSRYNCLAFAAGDTDHVWDPGIDQGYYWPPTAPQEGTIRAWVEALRCVGFGGYDGRAADLTPTLVKVVIFGRAFQATHAARQLKDGRWASKLGDWEAMEHDTPELLEGPSYGTIQIFMSRPRTPQDP
jgi:hypothetical protein